MPSPRQILCIDKTDGTDAHERIANVCGANPDGSIWKLTQADAVAAVEAGDWQFYASVWGRAVWLVVATTTDGHRYLKAETDSGQPHNLLTLPTCP